MTTPMYLAPELLRELAVAAKVCVRPVLARCTDTLTNLDTTVPIPCGATLARTCPSCADRARRLRIQQCREGWHRTEDFPASEEPVEEIEEGDGQEDDEDEDDSTRRVRSTRRRQDVADLPRVPMADRTVGRAFRAPDGHVYRPSMFLTFTLDSYGPVRPDGTPADPDTYDYRRAALDALHFPKLVDRLWQNIRRCAGYKVQYFAAVEPQRRLAPHLHAAVRGVIPRQIIHQVVAATYHQVWWPRCETAVYDDDLMPVWDDAVNGYVDPDTGEILLTWEQALDELDADPAAKPAHVVRLGRQFDYQGILASSEDKVGKAVGYLTKYLTKDIATALDDEDATATQLAHIDRLHAHIRVLPCSPRCANWLRYGVQPKDAKAELVAGRCTAKAHDRHHLGLGGRRVLVSRQWTGKTLAEHAADRAAVVRAVLDEAGIDAPDRNRLAADTLGPDGKPRYVWSKVAHHDQDALTYRQAINAAIRERVRWREQYDQAKNRAGPPGGDTVRQPRPQHEGDRSARKALHRRPGRRAAQHHTPVRPPAHRRATDRLHPPRPTRPHRGRRPRRLHRRRARRSGATCSARVPGECRLMAPKRRFGRVRRLPSGRFQVRYPGPDGLDRPAPETFERKTDAERWLIRKEAEILAGDWRDGKAGAVTFAEYATTWIEERPGLRPRTKELYRSLLRRHLVPAFGNSALNLITLPHVRRWRTELLAAGVGPSTVAKAYRLLRAILGTAVEDELIRRNPCRVKGAGTEPTPERPIATLAQVFAAADAIQPRYRALVLLGTFASLRWGELMGLRREDLDLERRTVRVERAAVEIAGQGVTMGPTKSAAGRRVVSIPAMLVPELRWHLKRFAEPGPEGRLFVGPKGATPRRSNFNAIWRKAAIAAGLPDLHFHDLRHTGNTLAAATGASLRELMDRMGHASTRAALIYQHATSERDRVIADALGVLAEAELERRQKAASETPDEDDDGCAGALVPR